MVVVSPKHQNIVLDEGIFFLFNILFNYMNVLLTHSNDRTLLHALYKQDVELFNKQIMHSTFQCFYQCLPVFTVTKRRIYVGHNSSMFQLQG